MTADLDLPVTPGRTPRFYFPDRVAPGASCALPDQAAHHAMRVLRMRPGDTVVLFNGDGREWEARIADMRKAGVSVKIGAPRMRDVEAPLPIALAQSISSRERMDLTLQKATELGVAQVWPRATQRSVVRLSDERAERRVAHWQHVVAAACEQCGRNRLPEIHPPEPFTDWLSRLPAQEGGLRLVLSPVASRRLADLPSVMNMPRVHAGITSVTWTPPKHSCFSVIRWLSLWRKYMAMQMSHRTGHQTCTHKSTRLQSRFLSVFWKPTKNWNMPTISGWSY